MFETRVVRNFDEPESAWTAPDGKLLYSGDDEAAAREAKRGFDAECDPCEGAVVTRLSDGAQLRDDVDEWALPARTMITLLVPDKAAADYVAAQTWPQFVRATEVAPEAPFGAYRDETGDLVVFEAGSPKRQYEDIGPGKPRYTAAEAEANVLIGDLCQLGYWNAA